MVIVVFCVFGGAMSKQGFKKSKLAQYARFQTLDFYCDFRNILIYQWLSLEKQKTVVQSMKFVYSYL